MSERERLTSDEWFMRGERDLASARSLLDRPDEFLATAGIFLFQAVLKYLKGYAVGRGTAPVETDELYELLEQAMAFEPDLQDFATVCVQLTDFYFDHRPPARTASRPVRAEVEQIFFDAGKLIARLRDNAAPPAAPAP